ncbi:electron transfer flavoprotein subunit alpha/FixB family protein [Rhodovulum sulfidophilum]|uniref:Electron transfer flavoprotein, alpha subunit n=1 Tax=Rhodovulum sulfidophilum TaxID=35806 RepID=A0A0D6B1J6_RHOSU|nr:electron transfer flavoprotein subunit alpha/FixB family protein [Rhodovulum sulfidophilum]ANB35281.1 electron transfer flavoprotein subunit alpha [Rhodovulum sulfidophilum DSM 1374]ANB39103.1 electron transfer flavoprotein subunit alpha [Rhodovulum sulfidophilum]MBK5923103.1 electron transfer flavoprotein subunit alpha [Rhodovulum sulfidophilum]MBL3551547.1 electron transfer flavoprotein subunit alpha/FixB family protein [Rhodovulum sulfidophilum]MBL3560580.1 electron transfer flavoprotein
MAQAPQPPAGSRAAMQMQLAEKYKDYKHVWVFIEIERGKVHPVSWELMGEGRKLADDLGVDLCALVLGGRDEDTKQAIRQTYHYGADVCYICEDPLLADYRNEPFTQAMTDLVNKYQPEILLLGATPLGRDLAGSVATTLQTGLTADATELKIADDKSLAATRPTFGGTLLCTIHTLNHRPQMATVRPRVMAMPEPDTSRSGRMVWHSLRMQEDDIVTKVLEFVSDAQVEKANLAYADIVVAGGLGLQQPQNLALVQRLAEVLGAEWGVSRPLVQKGWAPAERQIGQTGNTIRPKLYIAAGISGAIQHRVGVEGADLIIAINTDPEAKIFEFAHLGVVADALTVLPALTDAFARRLSARAMAS